MSQGSNSGGDRAAIAGAEVVGSKLGEAGDCLGSSFFLFLYLRTLP